jgi:hypothetical protein
MNLIVLIIVLWLCAAVGFSGTGRLQRLQPPAPQLILLGLTALVMLTVLRVSSVRRLVSTIPMRGLVAFHIVRLCAGAAFLSYYRAGELPAAFAIPSGWGDIAVAVLAAGLVLTVSPDTLPGRRFYAAWNAFGIADIAFVIFNAARMGMADPAGLSALLRLPLSLLPTFIVPLIIVSHVVLALRLHPLRDS